MQYINAQQEGVPYGDNDNIIVLPEWSSYGLVRNMATDKVSFFAKLPGNSSRPGKTLGYILFLCP